MDGKFVWCGRDRGLNAPAMRLLSTFVGTAWEGLMKNGLSLYVLAGIQVTRRTG